jgi:hypothetical protein
MEGCAKWLQFRDRGGWIQGYNGKTQCEFREKPYYPTAVHKRFNVHKIVWLSRQRNATITTTYFH